MTQTSATAQAAVEKRGAAREELSDWLVWIDGKTYPVKDWSDSGFLATSCDFESEVGEVLDLTFSVPADIKMVSYLESTLYLEKVISIGRVAVFPPVPNKWASRGGQSSIRLVLG